MHELTHVLQDQHFDIGDRLEAVAEEDTDEESLRVLVEGDADRIEELWVESLTDEEREALDAGARGGEHHGRARRSPSCRSPSSRSSPATTSSVPGSWTSSRPPTARAPSTRPSMTPPGPEEHVLDPIAFLEGDEASAVEPPDVDGEPIEDLDGDFGAVSWYLMLAERIDPVAALAAVDGWGGDQFRRVPRRRPHLRRAALRRRGRGGHRHDGGRARRLGRGDAGGGRRSLSPLDGDAVDVVTCDPGIGRRGPGGRRPLTGHDLAARDPLELASQVLEAGAPRSRPVLLTRDHRGARLRA